MTTPQFEQRLDVTREELQIIYVALDIAVKRNRGLDIYKNLLKKVREALDRYD